MRRTSLALLGGWLIAIFAAAQSNAQSLTPNPPSPNVSPIRVSPYLRVPVGSRAEAAQLKAGQDAALAAQRSKKKKGNGG